MNNDVTFIWHSDWFKKLDKNLTKEQEDAIIAEIARAGSELELKHKDDPFISTIVNIMLDKIEFSKDKYRQKVNASKTAGRKKRFSDKLIYETIKEKGYTISEEVANFLKCSKSTVDHSNGWCHRLEELEFDENGNAIL